MMISFYKPEVEVIRLGRDTIVTSTCISDCNCDWGMGPVGDDEICTHGTGEGGDVECVIQGDQGNC